MPALPSSLALSSIATGADILSADHRNNYGAIQTAVNAIIAALGVTAKGSLLAASASGALAELLAGTNGQALVADSTQSLGVKWAAAGAMTQLSHTLISVAGTVDVASISAAYSHLLCIYNIRHAEATLSDYLDIRFNNDSGANYNQERFYSQNATSNATGAVAGTFARCGLMPGSSSPASRFGSGFILIPSYANTTTHKSFFSGFTESGDDTAPNQIGGMMFGTWKSTAAINRLQVFCEAGAGSANLDVSSSFDIYGIL